MDRLFVDAADAAAVAVVNAVVDAQRLGDDKVAADHVNVRALQRRIAEAHRQPGGDIQLQRARRLLHQLKGFGIGHAGVLMVDRLVVVRGKVSVNLRARAVDQHQADA